MNLVEYDDFRPDADVHAEVLNHIAKRSMLRYRLVPMGRKFFIRVTVDWQLPEEDLSDKFNLALVYNGPQRGDAVIEELKCDSMLAALSHLSKLIEDRKQLKWNESAERWLF